jgi:hypothetical protein
MHILIIEPNLSGHHFIYLKLIVEVLSKKAHSISLITSDRYIDNDLLVDLKVKNVMLDIFFSINESEYKAAINSKLGNFGREFRIWRMFHREFKKLHSIHKIDDVFIPYLDVFLNAVALMGSPFLEVSYSGICMRQAFHYSYFELHETNTFIMNIKEILFTKLLKSLTLKKLFTIDELLISYFKHKNLKHRNKLCFLTDPYSLPKRAITPHDSLAFKYIYNIPQKSNVILVYGSIDNRKGLVQLLDTLETDANLDDWYVLVVGVLDSVIKSSISNEKWTRLKRYQRVKVINEYISEEKEHLVFQICDVVWIGYQEHYQMSGVLVRSGANKKPIIACEAGLIGWHVFKYNLGLACNIYDKKSVSTALEALRDKKYRDYLGMNGHEKFSNNTYSIFKFLLLKSIKI